VFFFYYENGNLQFLILEINNGKQNHGKILMKVMI